MFLRSISYTLIITLTTSLIAPPIWASAAIMRHYESRMDDYNADYKRPSIGGTTAEINRIFERAPSEKKANAEQKEQIFRTAMQTSTIHGMNAFLHGQTQTDANYYLSTKMSASNHHRILYGISALSYTYANILRSVSETDLLGAYGQFDTTKNALKSLLTSRKGRASFDGYAKISGISGSQFDDWFIDEFLKINQGIEADKRRYWWQPSKKVSMIETVPAKALPCTTQTVPPVKKASISTASSLLATPPSANAGGGVTESIKREPTVKIEKARSAAELIQESAKKPVKNTKAKELKVKDLEVLPPSVVRDEPFEQDAARHAGAFAERRAFNPIAMPSLVQNNFIRAIDMMSKMGEDITIFSFLFAETPTLTGQDYGVLGELASYLGIVKTQHDEKNRGSRLPGLLGLPTSTTNQRGTTYNFSHEEMGEPVTHPEDVQNFIDDATTAFQNGYTSYAGLIRNGKLVLRKNESPSSHYTVLFVTKNPQSPQISGVYAIDPGKKGGKEDEKSLPAYASVIIPLNEIGKSQGWMGYSPFDADLQSGNMACGLTATIIARHLISLEFDAVCNQEKMHAQVQKFIQKYGDKKERETAFAREVIHTFKEFYDQFHDRFEPLLDGHPDQIEVHNAAVMERNAITLKQCIDEYVGVKAAAGGAVKAAAESAAYKNRGAIEAAVASVLPAKDIAGAAASIPAQEKAIVFQFIDEAGNIRGGGSKGTTIEMVMGEYFDNGYQRALQSVYPKPTTPRNPALDAEVIAKLAEIGITE